MEPKYPLKAVNETGDTTIDVQLLQVPDSAITAGSGTVSIATATGDVTGPSSSTDNAIARFDSTTGKVIQNSTITVSDTGTVAAASGTLTLTSPALTTPALGTPASGVMTNVTGTAAGLTAGNVTTNANLTGPITSVGNATSVAAQTGTGSTFVMQTSPTLTTPNLGTPTAGVLSACTVATAAANDNDTSIASTAFVQGQGQGYLVYDATLTQTGTDAPTATVGQNNIGQTMTWAYVSPGVYTVTAGAAAFTANKTQILVGSIGTAAAGHVWGVRTSTTVITVTTTDDTLTPDNGKLTETAIRIVVFP